jgi:DNA-directed RNA polymerase specialized sigma24 family protein
VWPRAPKPEYAGWSHVTNEARKKVVAAKAQSLRENVFELLEIGLSIEEAAERAGISSRTVRKYLAGQ